MSQRRRSDELKLLDELLDRRQNLLKNLLLDVLLFLELVESDEISICSVDSFDGLIVPGHEVEELRFWSFGCDLLLW